MKIHTTEWQERIEHANATTLQIWQLVTGHPPETLTLRTRTFLASLLERYSEEEVLNMVRHACTRCAEDRMSPAQLSNAIGAYICARLRNQQRSFRQ